MDWLWLIRGTTQSEYAKKSLANAIKYKDLEALGRGLHSVQDEVAHGWLPISGRHLFDVIGWNPDKDYGRGRWEATEAATKKYLIKYKIETSPKI